MSRGSTYGISRVDNENSRTHGWLVTIQRRGVIYRSVLAGLRAGRLDGTIRSREEEIEYVRGVVDAAAAD